MTSESDFDVSVWLIFKFRPRVTHEGDAISHVQSHVHDLFSVILYLKASEVEAVIKGELRRERGLIEKKM